MVIAGWSVNMNEEQLKQVNAWTAEKCGVEVTDNWYFPNGKKWDAEEWTITDPRVMQVVREHFKIVTDVWSLGGWQAHQHLETDACLGKTIPEAEQACVLVIMEAEK